MRGRNDPPADHGVPCHVPWTFSKIPALLRGFARKSCVPAFLAVEHRKVAIDERIHLLSKFPAWGQLERLRIKDAFERIAAVSHGLFPIGGCKMVTGLANEREKSQNLQRQSKDRTRV